MDDQARTCPSVRSVLQTIDANVRSIFKSRLLYDGDVTITEKQNKSIVTYYNLEAIIFLSFRINTYCTKLFREWVLNSLCEYKRLQEKKPEVLVVFHPDSNRTTILITNVHRNL